MADTQQARNPLNEPHVGDVLVAPYPHDCDERLRDSVRVLHTTVTEYTGKPAMITAVRYQRGALRIPRNTSIDAFRAQFADWAVRQLGA